MGFNIPSREENVEVRRSDSCRSEGWRSEGYDTMNVKIGRIAIVMLVLCATMCGSNRATAQRGPDRGSNPNPSQQIGGTPNTFTVMRGGELPIQINLWGFVGSPGQYKVPASTSLIELLSLAGGPTDKARLVDIRIVHADTSSENRVQTYNLEAYRDNGDLSQNPLLVPGDTIIVSGRALDVFFQTITVITNIMVIVTALVSFIQFTKK